MQRDTGRGDARTSLVGRGRRSFRPERRRSCLLCVRPPGCIRGGERIQLECTDSRTWLIAAAARLLLRVTSQMMRSVPVEEEAFDGGRQEHGRRRGGEGCDQAVIRIERLSRVCPAAADSPNNRGATVPRAPNRLAPTRRAAGAHVAPPFPGSGRRPFSADRRHSYGGRDSERAVPDDWPGERARAPQRLALAA